MKAKQTSQPCAEYLLTASAVREKCTSILRLAEDDKLQAFTYHPELLESLVTFIEKCTRDKYPDLEIPYHSRWRHFEIADGFLLSRLSGMTKGLSREELLRVKFDLVITSVLLDAGAGPSWKYLDTETQTTFNRSEGLAVASAQMFFDGLFSTQADMPCQVDAEALQKFSASTLESAFQVSAENPLNGVEGRTELMRALGQIVDESPSIFGDNARLGNLADYLVVKAVDGRISAEVILSAVLEALGGIWPGRLTLEGVSLGDTWIYPPSGDYIPFHKLSQWLVYSLCEPLEEHGLEVYDIDRLTALAEYRNGGLLVDSGVLKPKESRTLLEPMDPASIEVIEWRAMTIAVIDLLAGMLREKLELSADTFPLAKVLEGGTWSAGRQLANSLREDGVPPIRIASDGTVF